MTAALLRVSSLGKSDRYCYRIDTVGCLNTGSPKNENFSFEANGELFIFRCLNI